MNNKEYKKLTSQIRQDFNNKIQPYYLGHTCEMCGSNNDLELHHNVPLSTVVLNLLKSDIDKKFYRGYAMGIQINNGFTTVCNDCHRNNTTIINQHNITMPYPSYHYFKERQNEYDSKLHIYTDEIMSFLQERKNKKLFVEDQKVLSDFMKERVYNSKTRLRGDKISCQKLTKILEEDFNINCNFVKKRQSGGENKGRRYIEVLTVDKKEDINEQQS